MMNKLYKTHCKNSTESRSFCMKKLQLNTPTKTRAPETICEMCQPFKERKMELDIFAEVKKWT